MGGRARRRLIVAALLAVAHGGAAQNPPPAPPRDTTSRQLMFEDVFTAQSALPGYVDLEEGVVYRVEVQPAQARVAIRVRRHPSLPPLLMVPMSGEGAASQTRSYLIVPRASDEYRIDVSVLRDEPVRLRIWTDPREMSHYAKMRLQTRGLPMAGFSVQVVSLGAFARPFGPANTTPSTPPGNASAAGLEACLALTPRGTWLKGPIGGCVLTLGRYWRPRPAGGMLFIGTEPRLELTRPAARVEGSVAVTLGIGTSVAVPNEMPGMDYLVLGVGLHSATRVPALGRHLYLEAEAGLARIQELAEDPETKGPTRLVPRGAAGLQLRF